MVVDMGTMAAVMDGVGGKAVKEVVVREAMVRGRLGEGGGGEDS